MFNREPSCNGVSLYVIEQFGPWAEPDVLVIAIERVLSAGVFPVNLIRHLLNTAPEQRRQNIEVPRVASASLELGTDPRVPVRLHDDFLPRAGIIQDFEGKVFDVYTYKGESWPARRPLPPLG